MLYIEGMHNTNPHSYKQVIALRMGEYVCTDHAVSTPQAPALAISTPEMNICYACATVHGEPKRLALTQKR